MTAPGSAEPSRSAKSGLTALCDRIDALNEGVGWLLGPVIVFVSLSIMYEVQMDNIDGGLGMLLNGLPFGMLPLTEGKQPGQTIAPIRNNFGSLSPVSDAMQMIDKYKQEFGITSMLRGKGGESGNLPAADTATGISLISQREDQLIAGVQAGCDNGIKRAMQLKLKNSSEFFMEPRQAKIEYSEGEQDVEYYPDEYSGLGFSLKIERKKPDVEAGKYMSWFKMLGLLSQAGMPGNPVPFNVFVNEAAKVGRALGIDDADQAMQVIIESMQSQVPPQIGGSVPNPAQAAGAPGAAQQNAAPLPPPPQGAPTGIPEMAGVVG
jgi:hypothetical protein